MEIWRNRIGHREQYLPLLSSGSVLCCFDVETTGLNEKDKVIQFSAQKFRVLDNYEMEFLSERNLYINPQEKLSKKIVDITGITDDQLEDMPEEKKVSSDIMTYINDADVWAGYNVQFDIRMLQAMSVRTGMFMDIKPYIDVLEMARDFCDQNIMSDYRLSTIVEYIFPENDYEFHNSMEDIKATVDILRHFIERYLEVDESERTVPIHLERASIFINPKKASQQRIRMHLAGGYDDGAIYYDVVNKVWSCLSKTSAKRLFKTCDMRDLERQFLEKYGYRFGHNTMDEVGRAWMQYRRGQIKAKQ